MPSKKAARASTSTTHPTTRPFTFKESEYQDITDALIAAYRRAASDIFSSPPPGFDRKKWLTEFGAFKAVVSLSMCTLDDSNLARVNYCEFTLHPLAVYHAVTSRLCREMEEAYLDEGKRLSREKQCENARDLKAARDAVCVAWKKDMEEAAPAVAAANILVGLGISGFGGKGGGS